MRAGACEEPGTSERSVDLVGVPGLGEEKAIPFNPDQHAVGRGRVRAGDIVLFGEMGTYRREKGRLQSKKKDRNRGAKRRGFPRGETEKIVRGAIVGRVTPRGKH